MNQFIPTKQNDSVKKIKPQPTVGITFNSEQKEIINKVGVWLNDENDYEPIVIAGSAGTGKTTIIRHIIDSVKIKEKIVTAPTHIAVEIVGEALKTKTATIQRLLGLRPNDSIEDFDVNNPIFQSIGKITIMDYRIVIIDEASMIPKKLDFALTQLAEKHSIKIIYVGRMLPTLNLSN